MVKEVNTIKEIAEPFNSSEFQSELYEYVNEYVRIRSRAKAGSLDHEPNVYISIRIFVDYEYFSKLDTLNSKNCKNSIEVQSILRELETYIRLYLNEENIEFKFKRIEDGGNVVFDYSVPRVN